MRIANKILPILLIVVLAVSGLIVVGSTSGQSIPTPSVPEFTIQLTDRSYDLPATYSTDSYTGKTVTHEGYHVENKTIDIVIKNQPFTPYRDGHGNTTELYYIVRTKGYFGTEWVTFSNGDGYLSSSTEYTTITFLTSKVPISNWPAVYTPPDGQVDFQVQAKTGYYYYQWVSMGLQDHPLAGGEVRMFNGTTSDWSDIHTFSVNDGSVSVAPSAGPESSQVSTPTQSTPMPTMTNPDGLAIENPTATPLPADIGADFLSGSGLWQVAVVVLCAVVAVLMVALLYKRSSVPQKTV
jgi:hypothetical protein